MKDIILASESPRRRELFTKLNLPFSCVSTNIDETLDLTIGLEDAVCELASRKAYSVFNNNRHSIVIGADTIVTLDNLILGKPKNKEDAIYMLRQLSGRTHKVLTGVCILYNNDKIMFCDSSEVSFYPLSDEEIYNYVNTGEPMDKAGAYGIQGNGALLVQSIKGDFYSIMGLPVAKINRTLRNIL